jgi:hypothetical protein
MRTVWTWLAIGGAILAVNLGLTLFGLTGSQLTTLLLIVGLMALSYQVNSLREANPKLKKKLVDDLLFSEPIEAKHNCPKNLTPDGKEGWGADRHDFECFRDFWYFGEAVNRDLELEHEWFRIQELADTAITGDLSWEGPAYGRRYEIFFNKMNVGLLQIKARPHRHFDVVFADHRRAKQDKPVFADVALDRVPVTALPYQRLYCFLGTIASLVTSTDRKPHDGGRTEYEEALSAIDHQLAETMWGALNDYTLGEPTFCELEVRLLGTPDRYYHIEAHERAERMQARADQNSRQSA